MKNLLGIAVVVITGLIVLSDQKALEKVLRRLAGREQQERQLAFELTDKTKEVGLFHIHEPAEYNARFSNVMPFIQTMGASVAAVDPSGSGWYDLYLTTSKTGGLNQYYRNNRDGTFSEVAKDLGLADVNKPFPAWRSVFYDYDRDGKKDLFLFSYCPRVFKNEGAKGYIEVLDHGLSCGTTYGGVNAFEVRKSGHLSFLVSPYDDENLYAPKGTKIFPNNFSGESNGTPVLFFENQGGGKFKNEAQKYGFVHRGWGHAVGVYDLKGRGVKDVWFPQDYNYERLYLNDGSDRFVESPELLAKSGFGRNGMGIDIADVDNDGRPLVFVTHIYTQGYKLSGNSLWKPVDMEKNQFVQEAGARGVADCGWAWSGRFLDFDNDGFLDLFVTNGFISASKKKSYWYTISVLDASGPSILEDSTNWPPMRDVSLDGYQRSCLFHNTRDGKFVDVAEDTDLAKDLLDGRGAVAIDFLNSGSPSLVVANQKGETKFYVNEQRNQNSWIGFKFVGTQSNPDGWGARVTITLKETKLTRELEPLNGYAAQAEDRLLIGLGEKPEIQSIEVQWPSGVRQKLSPLALNQYHTVIEAKE